MKTHLALMASLLVPGILVAEEPAVKIEAGFESIFDGQDP